MDKAGIQKPANIQYMAIDLEQDDLAEVFSAFVNLELPVFISCLGVLVYLKKCTCGKIFRFAGTLAKGSELVFTAKQNTDYNLIARKAADMGEPWITDFSKEELHALLTSCNFSEIHFLTNWELNNLYSDAHLIKMYPPNKSSIVKAKV